MGERKNKKEKKGYSEMDDIFGLDCANNGMTRRQMSNAFFNRD